jgi:beta-lactamase superfamily II metal-dependent hydrolase
MVAGVFVGGMIGIFLFDILSVLLSNAYEKRYPVRPAAWESIELQSPGDRLHFLNTDNADCILLESQGHFAMVDSGWGGNNPNKSAKRAGYEARILAYLKRVGGTHLDFVLPTHFHYDHAGGFPAIFADPAITVDTVYLRELQTGNQLNYELKDWSIEEIRAQIDTAARARRFKIETNLPLGAFRLGNFVVQFLNCDSYSNKKLRGENDNSTLVLLTLGKWRGLLTGDMTALHGLEKEIAAQVGGALDLLKLPHHGYALSSSVAFLRKVRPKLAVLTNDLGKMYPNVRWNLAYVGRCPVLSTVRENGVVVSINKNGQMLVTGNLHLE